MFVDIIEYSLQSFRSGRRQWKRRFNEYLARAPSKKGPDMDRVILDTGDGAAICFLGDPENAMFSALRLIAAMAEEKISQTNPLRVRVASILVP